jgi:ubiquinone/menaquinone biosynthesis C-methylase UbiE
VAAGGYSTSARHRLRYWSELVSEELSEPAELYGVDSDSELVNCPVLTDREPRLRLFHAAADSLPFPGTYFDVVYSRVAVPYTNIPVAMSEAFRVLKPRGISDTVCEPQSIHA